ncbi:thioredoxin family protein [Chitinophaga flava]|uniref:Thioredoxin n=1 Tax=Chitinophaga flava TaxID=2259036 RepID=A0A365XRH7_9BACT|nr:thioredoxin domain-containing protein [Chitinophaga flava]RBL88185.1 thiol reductase thioredoxin [Chitinophaga flava]
MPNEKIIILNDANFDREVLGRATNVLVQFWAPWSPPCRLVSPMVDALADEFSGKVVMGRLNVEVSLRVTEQYQVRGVPTLILFKNGGIVDRKTGVANQSALSNFIYRHLEL